MLIILNLTNNLPSNFGLIEEIMCQPHLKQPVRASQREPRFFSEVSPSSYLGQTEGLVRNSSPMYEVCDSKSEKSAPMYYFEGTLLGYSAFAWIVGLTNLAQ